MRTPFTISVRGIEVRARHGVLPVERDADQPFVADIDVVRDLTAAATTDDLDNTVSYAWLAEVAAGVLTGPPVNLVETLAGRIVDAVMADEFVESVAVTVHKPAAPMAVACAGAAVTVRRDRDRDAVVALGANLGDRARTMAAALADLAAVDGVRVRAVSPLVETEPVGPPQPAYLNAVALLATRLHPVSLLRELHRIEARHGRLRGRAAVRQGARTLDLDLLQVGDPAGGTDLPGRYGDLVLPHPRAHERAFVLTPWHMVDPHAVLRTPAGIERVEEILPSLPVADRAGVRRGPAWPTFGGAPW